MESQLNLLDKARHFVTPYYKFKDIMHDLSHIDRLIALSRELSAQYEVDMEMLTLAAYFHGIIYSDEEAVRQFLQRNLPGDKVESIIRTAHDSFNSSSPETPEGKILHDAHLLEGGKTFIITKSLVTGTLRGQTLPETINFIKQNILGKYKCCLPEVQELYEQKEAYAKEFLEDLMRNL